MTKQRRNLIALCVMMDKISEVFTGQSIEAVDRQACSDAGFLTGLAKPQTAALRVLMLRLWQRPSRDSLEELSYQYGDLGYRWMMFYVERTCPVSLNNTLRREIGNQARKLGLYENNLLEFYRQLYVDVINCVLRPIVDEVPLYSERQG